jgi:hypothetical protein
MVTEGQPKVLVTCGSVNAGAVVVDGVVYWGSGYKPPHFSIPWFIGNNKFYAFSLGGK